MSKKAKALMIMATAMALTGNSRLFIERGSKTTRKSDDDLKKNQGLKEFTINGKTVWALNLKNAKRKAK